MTDTVTEHEVWAGLTPPYTTIVADPPWSYRSGKGITTRTSHGSAFAAAHYSTMTNTEIAELPVAELAAPNAHCYLWVTNPHLYGDRKRGQPTPEEILEAWGFRYITLLTWVKTGCLGLGFYFRGDTEHVLFGVRGDLGVPIPQHRRNVFAIEPDEVDPFHGTRALTAAKTGHSRKPAHFFDLVESVSPGPYLELFSRDPRLGWDSWGHGYEIGNGAASRTAYLTDPRKGTSRREADSSRGANSVRGRRGVHQCS